MLAEIGRDARTGCTSSLVKSDRGVYGILCLRNNKWYVGQSTNVLKRLKNHVYNLRKGKHGGVLLQSAYNKHGEDSFRVKILSYCAIEELDEKEIYFIEHFNSIENGYNIENGGNKNKTISEYSRLKMSIAKKGKPSGRKGVKASPELRLKLSLAHKGLVSPKKGKPALHPVWNKGLKGVQISDKRKSVSVIDKYTGQDYGEYNSIESFRNARGYKSKNQTRISERSFYIGRYVFTYTNNIQNEGEI